MLGGEMTIEEIERLEKLDRECSTYDAHLFAAIRNALPDLLAITRCAAEEKAYRQELRKQRGMK